MTANDSFTRASMVLIGLFNVNININEEEIDSRIRTLETHARNILERRRAQQVIVHHPINRPPAELRPRQTRPPSPVNLYHSINSEPTEINLRRTSDTQPFIERVNALRSIPREPTVKTISRANFDANCVDMCTICHETHKKGDSMATECKHEFGKQCWDTWMANEHSNRKCPNCRKVCYRIITYKTRAPRRVSSEIPTERAEHARLLNNLVNTNANQEEEAFEAYTNFLASHPLASEW